MGQKEICVQNKKYLRIVPAIGKYLKNKNIPQIFKKKYQLLATGCKNGRVNIFTNSLEFIYTLQGYKEEIRSLESVSPNELATGASNGDIIIWNIYTKTMKLTLSLHTLSITALCRFRHNILISGSEDKSLVIWDKLDIHTSSSPDTYILNKHRSHIIGIVKIDNH